MWKHIREASITPRLFLGSDDGGMIFYLIIMPTAVLVAGLIVIGCLLIFAGTVMDFGILWILTGIALLLIGMWLFKKTWILAKEIDKRRSVSSNPEKAVGTIIVVVLIILYIIYRLRR
ncbi:MAG: hypothetical protein QHH24_02105 [Candidatus Bathyarchaeota archaeon]|nr:hypothetical protein [Candidatus Bathyarchaeota archaeon]